MFQMHFQTSYTHVLLHAISNASNDPWSFLIICGKLKIYNLLTSSIWRSLSSPQKGFILVYNFIFIII